MYQKRGSDTGSLNPNKNEMIPGRRSSFRTPSANDKEDPTLIDSRRRSSCRGQIGGTSDESFVSHRQPGKPKPMTDLSGKRNIKKIRINKSIIRIRFFDNPLPLSEKNNLFETIK